MDRPPDLPERLKELFNLQPLPGEGGLFAQTYQSDAEIPAGALPKGYTGAHPYGTAILYLLTAEPGSFSALHCLPTDEIYHFYLGDPVEILLLYPDGSSGHAVLGQGVLAGQHVQLVVPAGVWQGARLREGGQFALLGTTMAPGYTPTDYHPADREALLAQYPREVELIRKLMRE